MAIPNIFEPNPFKDSIYAGKGNAVSRDIYEASGFALSQWEYAETALGTMFSLLMRPKGSHIAFRAFGGIFSSGSRRELILAAAEAYFSFLDDPADEKLHQQATELHKSIRDFIKIFGDASRRRDEIAHGVVQTGFLKPGDSVLYFLFPAFYASKKTDVLPPFMPAYRLSSIELDNYAKLFGALMTRAHDLNRSLSAFYETLPEKRRALHP